MDESRRTAAVNPSDIPGFGVARPANVLAKIRDGVPKGFALALLALLLVNVLRDIATEFPQQLSDETAFLLSSRYFLHWHLIYSLGYMPVPGLVFLKIASFLASSDRYYLLVKIVNALYVTFAAIPAYFVARRVMSSQEATIASVLVAITPPTIYGNYFTPEANYIFVFWLFAAVSVAALNAPTRYRNVLGAGMVGAIAFLIKPHAIALGSAYVASAAVLCVTDHIGRQNGFRDREEPRMSRRACIAHVALFAIASLATLLVLGRILGGSWFASFDLRLYSELFTRKVGWEARLASIGPVVKLLAFHAAAIVAALAVPIATLAGFHVRRGPVGRPLMVLAIFSLTVVSMLVLMTARATVDFNSIHGGSNTLDRLHGRYYSFALPLLIFVAVGYFRNRLSRGASMRTMFAAGLATVAILACVAITAGQTFTFLDAPDLTYLLYTPGFSVSVIVATLIAATVAHLKLNPKWLILAAWALMSLINVYAATRFQHNEDREQIGDRAVGVLRGLFGRKDLDQGIIVASSHTVAAARAAFRLASLSPVVHTVSDASARANPSTSWVLVLGDQAGNAFGSTAIVAGDSAIYVMDPSRIVMPSDSGRRTMVFSFRADASLRATANPAHAPEPWGTWLSGPEVEIVFPTPLPDRGALTITANVLDPMRQNPVDMIICGNLFRMTFTGALAEHRIRYACAGRPDRIRFVNMKPLSPRDIGLSADPRALALAIESIKIEAAGR